MMVYHNPIIKGFHPDPSICRVGDDYYLVTSSFEYFPGIPIFHSRDLVNWKQIGNCLTKAEDYPLMNVKDSGGIWAPTIRYKEGRFYVTATLEAYGNFIVSTNDPRKEWSSPVWIAMGGIDPSILFDHGKAFYCTNGSLHSGREEIVVAEISPETGDVIEGPITVWEGIGGGFLEAPHVYHTGEWFYLMAAEGGTNFNHMITLARSRSIWGPYESCPWNPILTNVHDTSKEVQCTGHGDLFQDQKGNWWLVHLGRETFLTPVTWKEGWLITENNRKAKLISSGPLWNEQEEIPEWKADFYKEAWEPEWIFLRTPDMTCYKKWNSSVYSVDDSPLYPVCKASTRFLSCEMAGKCFTGTVIGVYAACTVETNAEMIVTKFTMN